jgi:DNA primase
MNDLKNIVEACQYILHNSPQGTDCKEYLNNRLDKEMQDQFSFGYFPNASNLKLLTSTIGQDILKNNNLMYSKDIRDAHSARTLLFCFFEDHPLILPYRDLYGNIIALVGRSLLNDQERKTLGIAKYKNTVFHKGNHLFGLYENKYEILKRNSVYVVEGQFDLIKAFERGIRNIVALGNSNMTGYQLSLICRYTNNIILLLDNDDGGEQGRRRIKEKYGSLAKIRDVYLPYGYKDLDEYLKFDNADLSLLD